MTTAKFNRQYCHVLIFSIFLMIPLSVMAQKTTKTAKTPASQTTPEKDEADKASDATMPLSDERADKDKNTSSTAVQSANVQPAEGDTAKVDSSDADKAKQPSAETEAATIDENDASAAAVSDTVDEKQIGAADEPADKNTGSEATTVKQVPDKTDDSTSQNAALPKTDEAQVMDTEAPTKTEVVAEKSVDIKQAPAAVQADALTDKEKIEENKRHMFVVTYNMAQPRGNTSKFVDKFSFEGFGFEYRFFLNKQLSLGLTFNWNTFERKESGMYSIDRNTTITATQIKMTDLIQLAPAVQYHFRKQSSKAVPFVGINMGPYYTSRIIDWGWWYERTSSWQFGVTPELGIRITALPVPLYLALRYSYAFKANDIPGQQTFGINLGIAFLK